MDYSKVKKSLVVFWSDLTRHPFKTICILFLMVLIIIVSTYFREWVSDKFLKQTTQSTSAAVIATDSNVIIGNSAPVSQTINNYPDPKLMVSQEGISLLKEDGFYHTVYFLVFDDPIGILDGDKTFHSNAILTDCLEPTAVGFQLIGARMAQKARIECRSKEAPPKPEETMLFCLTTLCPKEALFKF